MPAVNTATQVSATTTLEESRSVWWMFMVEGILAILFGWLLLARPAATIFVLVQVMALYWLIVGIIDIIMAIFDKNADSRGWKLLGGIIGLVAGLIILNNALLSGIIFPIALVYLISFAFLANGIIKILIGNIKKDKHAYERSWGSFFVGVFYIAFGLFFLGMPMIASVATIALTGGMLAIAGGIAMIIASFQIKKAGN
jgi:uncharacterized membrane protein HdeD (DUF308 family)